MTRLQRPPLDRAAQLRVLLSQAPLPPLGRLAQLALQQTSWLVQPAQLRWMSMTTAQLPQPLPVPRQQPRLSQEQG